MAICIKVQWCRVICEIRAKTSGGFGTKTVGIVGGIGPESTIEYYRLIIAMYREQRRDGGYPSIIINSIDMKRMLDLIGPINLQG
jgi:2-iminoacetate synthase ThiH